MAADTFVLDLTGYKDRVGSHVPEGRYKVLVEDAEMDKSKAGNPMVNVWYQILEGDNKGQTIVDRLTITEKALFRVVGFMQAIGLPTPKKRLQLNLRQFVGKVLEIDVEDGEPYNGRIKSEVRKYLRVGKTAGEVNDEADLDLVLADDAPDDLVEDEPDADLPADPEPEVSVDGSTVLAPEADAEPAKAKAKVAEAPEASEEIDLADLDLG